MVKIHTSCLVMALLVWLMPADAFAMLHPEQGRFMQRDPGRVSSPARTEQYRDGMNLHQYLRGNPSIWRDPSGLAVYKERTGGTEAPGAGGTMALENGDIGVVKVWKDATWKTDDGRSGSGYMQLEFTTKDKQKASCHKCGWVQFGLSYRTPKEGPGYDWYVANNTFAKYGEWYLDVPWQGRDSVFYDTYGMSNRTGTEVTIFDAPSVLYSSEKDIEAGHRFESYLVCNNKVYWNVHWEYVCKPNDRGVWACGYTNITGKAADGFGDFNTKKWRLGYNRKDDKGRPVEYDNPFYVEPSK